MVILNIVKFFILTLILACSVSPVIVNAKPTPVILLLGDSLSAAYGIDPTKGWATLLEQRLKQNHFDYKVVNASISGDTTQNGLLRLPASLAKHQADVLIIELGANDGLRGLSLTQMKDNLSKMIELSQQHNAKVILAGMRIPPNYGKRYTEVFSGTYISLSKKYKVGLIPFLLKSIGGEQALMQADGLHPNELAQSVILENVWPYLKPLLTK